MMKNAPTEGGYTKGIEIQHRPFGFECRRVRCLKCGNLGHATGDRVCPLLNLVTPSGYYFPPLFLSFYFNSKFILNNQLAI